MKALDAAFQLHPAQPPISIANTPMSAPDDSFVVDSDLEQFERRPELQSHLAALVFKSLASKPFEKLIVDLSTGRRELKSGIFLAAAIALSRRWKSIPGKRVGVVFPAGIGSAMTNLALALADKVPVNLNFTAGRSAIEASIRKAGITHIITAKPVMDRAPDFPWTPNVIDLVEVRKGVKKAEVIGWLACILATPSKLLIRMLGVPTRGGDKEAALLFSSGSTGEPKGVVLTHKNIIGNCLQIETAGLLETGQVLMANLPTFHSFGCTVTLWYALYAVMKTVCLPNPLETRRVAQAIKDEGVTAMMGTPTFYRPYFKKVEPEMIKSLQFVVAGAEKTPAGFADQWEKTFGSTYLEGYGLTETAPVVSANLPPSRSGGNRVRRGSVGRIFPGMQARIVDDTTGEVVPPTRRGVLQLRGVNVFPGYLDDVEANNRVFDGEWFHTGDLARFDEDGYLYIEGRISRFSKIGGEMVPHGTIEQAVMRAFQLEDADLPMVAVTGMRDSTKGESLVLLTAVEIDPVRLRERLTAAGMPNLWIPRRIRRVERIPCLASGKLDLKALETLANSATDTEEEAV